MPPDVDVRRVQRDDLRRSAPFTTVRAEGQPAGDGFTLDGYGAVFDSVTEIDSWEGTFEEVISRGAFRKTLREKTPRLQFDHGRHPLIGSIPIGVITEISEDDHGLHVVARLSDNWLVEPVRDAIAAEAIDGMSFRFSVVRDSWADAAGRTIRPEDVDKALWYPSSLTYDVVTPLRRTLKEVKMPEVGPVVWPAYTDTTVGVRSQVVTIDLGRLADPETRKTLARAVLMADAADATDAPPAGHPSTRTEDAPPNTTAAGHPDSAPPDADEPTVRHPSAQSRQLRDRIRASARDHRGYLTQISDRTDHA